MSKLYLKNNNSECLFCFCRTKQINKGLNVKKHKQYSFMISKFNLENYIHSPDFKHRGGIEFMMFSRAHFFIALKKNIQYGTVRVRKN